MNKFTMRLIACLMAVFLFPFHILMQALFPIIGLIVDYVDDALAVWENPSRLRYFGKYYKEKNLS